MTSKGEKLKTIAFHFKPDNPTNSPTSIDGAGVLMSVIFNNQCKEMSRDQCYSGQLESGTCDKGLI